MAAAQESIRAVPDAAVQEFSFENDVPSNDSTQQQLDGSTDIEASPKISGQHNNHGNTNGAHTVYGSFPNPDTISASSNTYHDSNDTNYKLSSPTKATSRALAPDLLRGLLMVLMALDHNVLTLNPWPHETAPGGEVDSGGPVHEWNRPIAYVIRSLTHLCAPGFIFLLGMGVVYFGRSRSALGWSSGQMIWHFMVRTVVLTLVTVVFGLVVTVGQIWFFNVVLFALAFDYFITGMLWLAISRTEESLAILLLKVLPDAKNDNAREPLLADRRGEEDIAPDRKIMRAADISWHLHNAFLLSLAIITISWNILLSPTHGHCTPESAGEVVTTTTISSASASASASLPDTPWIRIWFFPIRTPHVMSSFPPFAWLSFAILGLLYGRIVLARTWTKTTLAIGNTAGGLVFLVVFVLTRVLRFGNLSEGCLHMPEHKPHLGSNQYLASWPSFFYLVKYPPDVAFWSYAMGFNLLLMAFFGAIPVTIASRIKPLIVYGTSALFFYVVHLLLLFAATLLWLPLLGRKTDRKNDLSGEESIGVDNLWVYWLNWALVLTILYPMCSWYGGFKKTKKPDSIWRFF